MPTVLDLAPPAEGPPNPKRWTRAELRQMIDAGLPEFERYELFGGELIDKMKNRPHSYAVYVLVEWLRSVFVGCVMQEAAIDLRPEDNATHRPEPDATVLKRSAKAFVFDDPAPEDVKLVVEVSDSTLRFDLGAKASKYSQAGIPEYWVLDLTGRRLIVHRDPGPERYGSILAFAEHEPVAPLAAPDHAITAAALLPIPIPY